MAQTTADRVATEAHKARLATERRNEAIRQMRAEGGSLREIAQLAWLSHTQVSNIVGQTITEQEDK